MVFICNTVKFIFDFMYSILSLLHILIIFFLIYILYNSLSLALSSMGFEKCTEWYIHCLKHMIQNSSITPTFPYADSTFAYADSVINSSQPLAVTDPLSGPIVLPFLECHMNRILQSYNKASWLGLLSFRKHI